MKGKETKRAVVRMTVMSFFMLAIVVMLGQGVQAKAKKITLNKTSLTMVVKDTYTLKVKGTSAKPKWTSSNKRIVTVSKKGKLTAKKKGKAIITAKAKGKKYKCKVTVKKAPVLSKKRVTVEKGRKTTLKLKYTVSKPKWKSKSSKIAKVSKSGVVTGVKLGTTKITATLRGKKYTCTVKVVPQVLRINDKTPADFKKDLYIVDPSYDEVLTVPESMDKSFQIKVTGNKETPEFKVVSGRSVTVDEKGVVTPKETVWYWNGNIGSTTPSGKPGEKKVVEYNYGTSVIEITVDGTTVQAEVTLHNYANVYADEKLDEFIKDSIKPGMTEAAMVEEITKYVAHTYDYSASHSGYVSMIAFGGGDCWASTSMILELCDRLNIQARQHYVNGNSWGGHRNVAAFADGETYILDAGYSGKAPRYYSCSKLYQGFSYSISDGKARVQGYEGFGGSVVKIPETINGYPVDSISKNLFYSCVVYGNQKITEVHIPDSVTTIAPQAFYAGGYSMERVVVDEKNPNYCDVDGVLYTKDKSVLCFIPPTKKGDFVMEDNVTEIQAYAASYCSGLTSVTLSDKVTTIGEATFWNCSGLKLTVLNKEAVFGEGAVDASNATIYGYAGSTAETYAKENEITFVAIEEQLED